MIADLQESAPTPAAQYPSESGHWYDPSTGQQVEIKRGTWAKTALKKGYVPGVTSITRLVARGALERWKINRAILLTTELPCDQVDYFDMSDESIIAAVWEKLDAESEAITGRGKELHAAIERYATDNAIHTAWTTHITAIRQALAIYDIDLCAGSPEHSFATERYGGKVDWHNDTWLLDFKTKDKLTEPERGLDDPLDYVNPKAGKLRKLAYPEHAQQLAAYARGLSSYSSIPHCANVFVGVEDASVHVHEWTPEQLAQGWREFEALLGYWWIKNDK